MFQTKFDRWLIETFIYEHHIRVVRLPEKIPSGVTVSEIRAQQYHFLLVAKNSKKADHLIEYLTDTGSVFSTKIVEGQHWYNRIIFNKSKSFTFKLIWLAVLFIVLYYGYLKFSVFSESDLFIELKATVTELLKN